MYQNMNFVQYKMITASNVQNIQNGQNMKRRMCVLCGSSHGRGILNKTIINLLFELHIPGQHFTGPGIKLDKRITSNLTPNVWYKPINCVDNAAYHHVVCYLKKDTETKNKVCDKNILDEMKDIINPTFRERNEPL